jgi:DNA repair exonuclease SbcCD ATPase subunit
MKIKNTKIKDILSIKDMELDFGDNGLLLIDGWNNDDNSANGAGKTAIFNAVSFAIYNKFPRKISISKIVRRGTKKGGVYVALENSKGDLWAVERSRPSGVKYFKNGQEQDITQEGFEQAIGLSYEQFLITMYTAQSEGKKLISLNDTGKKDFFLQLMNLEKFGIHKKETDILIKELKAAIIDIEKMQVAAQSKITVYQDLVTDIPALKEEIKGLNYDDLAEQRLGLSKIARPNLSRYQELERKIDDKMAKAQHQQDQNKICENQILAIDQAIADARNRLLECPKCGTNVVKQGTKVHHLDDFIKIKEEQKASLERQKIPVISPSAHELATLRLDLNNKRNSDLAEYTAAQSRIVELDRVISARKAKIEHNEAELSRGAEYEKKIVELNSLIDKASTALKSKNKELEILETISNILSPTGAPAYIMDSLVDIFNDKMSSYVSMIWPNATYSIQTYKTNKSGDVKAKFSENLVIAGHDTEIGGLSGGEHKCLSLAMDFAVVNLLESMFAIQVNPIILDEPFDGLDSTNRERVIELLEEIAVDRQIIVIDHASEAKAMFSQVIKIEKTNGVSALV